MIHHVTFQRERGEVEPLIQLTIIARSIYLFIYFPPACAPAPNPVAHISKASSWEESQAGHELPASTCNDATE